MYRSFIEDILEKNDIFENFLNFTLEDLKFDLDINNIIKYQEEVNSNKHITDFFIKILKNIKFFTYESFLEILNNNCQHIKNISLDEHNRLFLYFDISAYKKSNFFYTVLTYLKLKREGVNIEKIITDINSFNTEATDPELKYYLIVCDDVSYSGEQLFGHLSYGMIKFNPNTHIFINLIAYTNKAFSNFASDFYDINSAPKNNNRQLVIGSGVERVNNNMKNIFIELTDSVDENEMLLNIDIFNLYQIDINNEIFTKSIVKKEKIFEMQNLKSIILLFQKYPDEASVYQHLCFLRHFNCEYTLNLYNLLNKLNVSFHKDILTNLDDLFNYLQNLILARNTKELNMLDSENLKILHLIITNRFVKEMPSDIRTNDSIMNKINELFKVKVIEKPNNIFSSDIKKVDFSDGTYGIKSIDTTYKNEYSSINYLSDGDFCKSISIIPFYKNIEYFFIKGYEEEVKRNFRTRFPAYIKSIYDSPSDEIYKKYLKYKKKYLLLKKI
tara:strand:- start:674 stop:2173 length:1500 start_codon:yes stop_codon:yes gene_type:complete